MLSDTQNKLLDILINNQNNPLTIRDIQELLSVSSPSLVHYHVVQLEKKGFLKRNPSNHKDYQILHNPEKEISYLNLYGMAKCGPGGKMLSGDPEDRIPLASRLITCSAEDAFLVKAYGVSMEPKIFAGDLIICKKQNVAENRDIIICTIDREEVLIKQYFKDEQHFVLESFNRNVRPIICHENELQIEGIVVGLISSNIGSM